MISTTTGSPEGSYAANGFSGDIYELPPNIKILSNQPLSMAGTLNHHSGNWKITKSAHNSTMVV
jgi:hypothetical protein